MLDIGMRGHGRDTQEEWFVCFHCVVEEAEGLCSKDVGGVLPLVADGRILVALVRGVEIAVGEGVEEEVGARPARRKRAVVV